jgi:acetylornithine deacetylase/succinyl-diaminopimelate desuccinylase-like protein
MEFLQIPSVSTQPEFSADCTRAREFLVRLFSESGLIVSTLPSEVHDAIFAQTPYRSNRPTVLIYGHYDVQPAGAPSQWTTPAFEPNIRKNRVYARGATDNKGQIMIHIMALRELISKFGLKELPVNIKFIIEGEEEIGSPGVENLLSRYPDLFAADYIVLSDTEMLAPGFPSIDVSLRGVVDVEIELQIGSHDMHSGQFGGVAPNPAFLLAHILTKLKNGQGRVMLPGFYQDVLPLTPDEASDFKRLEPKAGDILKDGHFYFLGGGENGLSLNRRRWSEPTLDITGLESGYTGPGTKTIIPNTAEVKLSMRLVPNQNPQKIYRNLVSFLQKNTPKRACLRVFMYPAALPYKAPTKHPVYTLAKEVLKTVFNHPAVFVGQGGSIGFVPVLARKLNVPCLLIGFGLPDENVHAPNEHFSLENYENGITAMTLFYSDLQNLRTDASKSSLTSAKTIYKITET